MRIPKRQLIIAFGLVLTLPGMASAQQTVPQSMVGPALRVEVQIPFTMKTLPDNAGVSILSYSSPDGLLRQSDVISWVATPNSNDDGVAVTSTGNLEDEISARLSNDKKIALWVSRGTDAPKWVILTMATKSVEHGPAVQSDVVIPFSMKTLPDKLGVIVLSYAGEDGLLRQGDFISRVATPDGRDPGVAVTSARALEVEVPGRLTQDNMIGFWVQRGPNPATWVILTLETKSVSAPPPTARLPFTVREVAVQGVLNVEVVSYSGTDRLLVPGDVIVGISKRTDGQPGTTAVLSAAGMKADILALRGRDGGIGLVVLRNGNYQETVLTIPASNPSRRLGTPTAEESSKLHMLSVSNRDRNESEAFRWGCYFDVYRMESFLKRSIPSEQNFASSTFHAFKNEADTLLSSIRTMAREQVGPNDTFLVYYSGHGRNDATQGHMLELTPGEKVTRAAIRQAMQESGARLCMLITDCCATGSKAHFGRIEQKVFGTPDYTAPYWNANICRYLFFRHKGFVDITSCGPGELAWSVNPTDENGFIGKTPEDGNVFEHGGLFTTSLLEILAMNDGELERQKMMDQQGRVTWSSMIGSLKKKTEDRFQKRVFAGFRTSRQKRKHEHQTVTDISLGQPIGTALPTTRQSMLGFQFADGPNGVVVTDIDSDQTASWVGLKPGDRVIRIGRQAEVPVYAHFWKDRKFSNGVLLGTNPTQINSLNQLRQLTTADNDGNPPFLASGMWLLTVQREESTIEVPVRITGPSGAPYGVYSIEQPVYAPSGE